MQGVVLVLVAMTAAIWWQFASDIADAKARAARGSTVIDTPCGPIEYKEAGTGQPLLAVHGSGGGFDQGMAFSAPLAVRAFRVIAMSRFGYLRTPMPADGSAEAQADAYLCLMDARWMCQQPPSWAGPLGRFARCNWPSGIRIGCRP
jgi:hypothetical protein